MRPSSPQHKTRLAFIHALLRLVNQRGLEHISVTEIANEADYGRWTFYQYFRSKEEAAYAAFVHWMTQLDEQLIAQTDGLASPEREYRSWCIIFETFHQYRYLLLGLSHAVPSAWNLKAREFIIAQFTQHLQSGRFRLMAGVRPEIAARLYVMSLVELLEYWGNHPEIGNPQQLVDEFFTFIFNQPPPR